MKKLHQNDYRKQIIDKEKVKKKTKKKIYCIKILKKKKKKKKKKQQQHTHLGIQPEMIALIYRQKHKTQSYDFHHMLRKKSLISQNTSSV